MCSSQWSSEVGSITLPNPIPVFVAQLCPTLCDPTDCSQPGSSVRGILQARILAWQPTPVYLSHPKPPCAFTLKLYLS